MFVAGKSTPKIGEIRFGYASDDESRLSTHKYVGVHPYLVVSNNTYNKTSGQCEVIPFTTKRIGKYNPVHVEYKAGEVSGLVKDSTLIIEGRDTLLNCQLSEPVGEFTEDNWGRVVEAMKVQCPFLRKEPTDGPVLTIA